MAWIAYEAFSYVIDHHVNEGQTSIHNMYIPKFTKGLVMGDICQIALGSIPLGLTSDLPRGPRGARGMLNAQDLARCLHCNIGNWARAYVNAEEKSKTADITFWLVLAISYLYHGQSISSLFSSANMPGNLECNLMCEMNHGVPYPIEPSRWIACRHVWGCFCFNICVH